MEKKMNKKLLLGVGILVALIAVFAVVFALFRAKPVEGGKTITIEVINKEQKSTVYEVNTDAEFLRGAMDEAKGLTYEGTMGEYGMSISHINGERGDYVQDGAYWAFYVNGGYCNYGIDAQPIYDGDAFQIVYTSANQ